MANTQAQGVPIGQTFKWQGEYYRRVEFQGLAIVPATRAVEIPGYTAVGVERGLPCIVAHKLGTDNTVLIIHDNPVETVAVPVRILPKDMRVGDVVRMSHVPEHPFMSCIVAKIDDLLVYLDRPHMRVDPDTGGIWIGVEHFVEYLNAEKWWDLLRR